jgi:ATP-dependent helicase HrpB
MLHTDNALEEVGLVIFDEFHERNLQADLAMALCRETQQVLRPDLRILIMSATLNMPQLKSLLKAPLIESKGRHYPVEIIYAGEADETLLPELTARAVSCWRTTGRCIGVFTRRDRNKKMCRFIKCRIK